VATRTTSPSINSITSRAVFVDNVASHDLESEGVKNQLSRLNASFRFLVANATDRIQPCDSYHWEAYKFDAVKKGMWQDVSGAIKNPGKCFFLKLAATAVQEVNNCRDSQGLTFARKAMIRCGLSLDITGQWYIGQLIPIFKILSKNTKPILIVSLCLRSECVYLFSSHRVSPFPPLFPPLFFPFGFGNWERVVVV